ncbi:hypothetical protein EXIGLDRAFT_734118 [Exidia glandulosa HHB12029]|uniref:Uncharacterized protein n=1 Tax=Exidia glandulosa HHB12029 TaxID=1314781 RepID=A0A165KA31_EXIGL|nr:hypothetical protein EXIGLDRAFT_734118 [Exidia glandulosa HHB12029]
MYEFPFNLFVKSSGALRISLATTNPRKGRREEGCPDDTSRECRGKVIAQGAASKLANAKQAGKNKKTTNKSQWDCYSC